MAITVNLVETPVDVAVDSSAGSVSVAAAAAAAAASVAVTTGNTAATATKTVSVVVGRSSADYICTGSSGSPTDHTTIQNAINSIAATGGVVYIREGTYYLGDVVNIVVPNIQVIGSGRATELRAMSDYGDVFFCALGDTPIGWPGMSGLAFRSLRFETAVNRTMGAAIRADYTHDAQFHDLYISDTTYGISYGIGAASPHFWDGIYLQAQDQCDIANVTAQCKRYCVYMDGSGYASADFSYDGLVRDCDFYGVPTSTSEDPDVKFGTGIYIGNNIGGVVIDYCSINNMEYAVEAVMGEEYTQGGGIVTIRGGYTENNTAHGYRIVNYQNAIVTDLWGALLLQDVATAFVTATSLSRVVVNGGYATIYGTPNQVTGDGSWAIVNGSTLGAKAEITHSHGQITSDGKLGSTSGKIAVTTTAGAVTTATVGDGLSLSSGTLSTASVVRSLTAGITGATAVANIVAISQANYDALASKDSSTIYVIV